MVGLLASRIIAIDRLSLGIKNGSITNNGLTDFIVFIDSYLLLVVLLHSPIVLL